MGSTFNPDFSSESALKKWIETNHEKYYIEYKKAKDGKGQRLRDI